MALSLTAIKDRLRTELAGMGPDSLRDEIARNLMEPRPVTVLWDYGAPGERFPAWLVVHAKGRPQVSVVYCDQGFGPRCPWGLVWSEDEPVGFTSGQDSGWFPTLEEAYIGD